MDFHSHDDFDSLLDGDDFDALMTYDPIHDFLANVIRDGIHLCSIVPDGKCTGRWFGDDVQGATTWARRENDAGKGLFWTVNRVREGLNKKPAKSDIVAARFVHGDIDPPHRFDAAACPVAPSIVINSGNGGQPLWRLEAETTDIAAVEAANNAMRAALHGDTGTWNADRLLRLPGTTNYPNAKKRAEGRVPVTASIVLPDNGATVDLADMPSLLVASNGKRADVDLPDAIVLETPDSLNISADAPLRHQIVSPAGVNRSNDAFAVACEMVRQGFTNTQIAGLLLNPENAVSAHCMKFRRKRERLHAARNAIGNARGRERPIDEGLDELGDAPLRREEQRAENVRIQDIAFDPLPPRMSLDRMHEDCVWVTEGSAVARLSNPRQVLSFPEFRDLTAASKSVDKDGKKFATADLWKASARRQTVETRTFHPGAEPLCRDADGKPAVNSWRAIERRPAARDVAPFLEQLDFLFPDAVERGAFVDWLAHVEQQPGVLPHYGWLHIAANTGTGRNWVASVLSRVWRGWVAPNVDLPTLLDSQFNGQIASRILAIVDEVQEGAGENPFRHQNRLKSLVNAEYRDVNPKFGRQYREHNACRWLVFSNHDNALPLNDTDRRWRVVRHEAAPRPAADYTRLYALLGDVEFINAVGVYLRERDISAFNPGARPPMTAAKRAAVAASKTLVQGYAEELVRTWKADVITNSDAVRELADGGTVTALTPAMRRALEEAGAVRIERPLWLRGRNQRCWILRNSSDWMEVDLAALQAEVSRPWMDGTF